MDSCEPDLLAVGRSWLELGSSGSGLEGEGLARHWHFGKLRAHLVDGLLVVGRVEDGGAGDEHVGARLCDLGDVGRANAAVNLERDVVAALIDKLARLAQLVERRWDELLASEARVHRHEQHNVNLVHDVLEAVERRGGVEHEARLAAGGADQLQRAVNMAGGLRVEGDVAGAGIGKLANDAVNRRHHQVDIDGGLDAVIAQRLADHRANRQVWHVVVVHHVEVDSVSASSQDIVHFLPQVCEVCRQDGWGDDVV
mmetsp:Transcript_10127/g.21569  ORF Transcript_10127/g.21569 Transcript_10127/m.21569 type:complete len:255 (+) Transcript_10127:71-835(+)